MATVDLLRQTDLPDEYQYLLSEDALGEIHLLCAMANNPPVLQSYMRYGSTLWRDAGIDPRTVELAILAVARELEARYEWHQHAELAAEQGVSEAEMLAISEGDFDVFDDDERALLTYVQAVARADVDDDARERFADDHDDATVVGVTLLATHYVATALFLDALDVPLEEEFVGWRLENAE